MPYEIRKIKNKNKYQVVNLDTGDIKAKGTTKAKAENMIKVLHMIEGKRKRKH